MTSCAHGLQEPNQEMLMILSRRPQIYQCVSPLTSNLTKIPWQFLCPCQNYAIGFPPATYLNPDYTLHLLPASNDNTDSIIVACISHDFSHAITLIHLPRLLLIALHLPLHLHLHLPLHLHLHYDFYLSPICFREEQQKIPSASGVF